MKLQSSLMQRVIPIRTLINRIRSDEDDRTILVPTSPSLLYIHANTICYDELNHNGGKHGKNIGSR